MGQPPWPPDPLYLQELLQPQLGELILEMDAKVHVLHRVHHNVDELHAGDLRAGLASPGAPPSTPFCPKDPRPGPGVPP